MVGRKVINTNRFLTQEEIFNLMNLNWDKEKYNNFIINRVNNVSQERYILLPVNEHFLVFIYPIHKNLFHKSDGIVLSSYDYTMTLDDAAKGAIIREISPLSSIKRDMKSLDRRKEQCTIVEDILNIYTDELYNIIRDNDLLNESVKTKRK